MHRKVAQLQERRAVSLIEIVVVIGIIGLLLAIILPAVSSAREAARRMSCKNNLRQLSMACHSFHDVHRTLPKQNFLIVPQRYIGSPGAVSVWGQLLPYLEQNSLYYEIDFTEVGGGTRFEPRTSDKNSALLIHPLSILKCPSDKSIRGSSNYRASLGSSPGPPHRGLGAFFSLGRNGRKASFSMISDGLSQTAMCSEKLIGDQNPAKFHSQRDSNFTDGFFGDADIVRNLCATQPHRSSSQHASFGGSIWFLNGYGNVWYNHVDVPNSKIADCTNGGVAIAQGQVTARSLHPGGVNVAMADGAVHFASESIDLKVWRSLGTRAGSEVVTNW